jgi:hypothetical protein
MKKRIIGILLIILAALFSACEPQSAEDLPMPTVSGNSGQNSLNQGGGNDNENCQKLIMALSQVIITPTIISQEYFTEYNYKYGDGGYVYLCSVSLLISAILVFSDEDFVTAYISPDADKYYKDKSKQIKLEINTPCVFDISEKFSGNQYNSGDSLYLSVCVKNFFMTVDGKLENGAGDAVFNLEFNLSENEINFYGITADQNLNGFKSGGMVFDLTLIFTDI